MSSNVLIRKLGPEESGLALSLVWKVFLEFEAPDYTKEGVDEFYKSIHDDSYISKLCFYGAFIHEKLTGVIATRNEGSHIALFFVDGKFQKQGIGRQLFLTVRKQTHAERLTVNSSPFAVAFYHKIGFVDQEKEQSVNGLRFTPMELNLNQKASKLD